MNVSIKHIECKQHSWFSVTVGSANGVVVLLHGLNQNPLFWRDMIEFLIQQRLHVLCVRLSGHRGLSFSDMKDVSATKWLREFSEAYDFAASQTDTAGLPLYCLGYSMGGLLATVAQIKAGRPLFDRQLLLAPAICPKFYTRLVLPVIKIVQLLPARDAKKYVANREGTSANAYRAMFDFESLVRTSRKPPFMNIPTKVVMDRRDELISYRSTAKFIDRERLSNWQLLSLPDSGDKKYGAQSFRHLVIDRESLGQPGWDALTSEICDHFNP